MVVQLSKLGICSMHKRIVTAMILAPLALAVIWLLSVQGFAVVFGIVMLLGAFEWARLTGLRSRWLQLAYLVGLLLLLSLGWLVYLSSLPNELILLLATLWWFAALAWLWRFSQGHGESLASPVVAAVVGYVVLGLAWFSLVVLHGLDKGAYFVTLLLLVVWGADVGAFFAGRNFGHYKLAAQISPGKTWEGVLGGLVLAIFAGVFLHTLLSPAWLSALVLLPLLVLTVLFSVVGDLFESMLKRQHGAKDSGNLLPGHGGILDRIDSLTAAAPVFAMALLWLQLWLVP